MRILNRADPRRLPGGAGRLNVLLALFANRAGALSWPVGVGFLHGLKLTAVAANLGAEYNPRGAPPRGK